MAVLMFAAVALVAYRFWMRLRETETALEKLAARIGALELTGTIDVLSLARGCTEAYRGSS